MSLRTDFAPPLRVIVIAALCALGQAHAKDEPAAVSETLHRAPRVVVVLSVDDEHSGLVGDIGPSPDFLTSPMGISSQQSAMNAGAGSAGIVGAAIGGAIVNAMILSDLREQARLTMEPLNGALEAGIMRAARESALAVLRDELGVVPARVVEFDTAVGPYSFIKAFPRERDALLVILMPSAFLTLDRSTLRARMEVTVTTFKKGKVHTEFSCNAAHISVQLDELTRAAALDVWRADGAKRAREELVEAYSDSLRSMLAIARPLPEASELGTVKLFRPGALSTMKLEAYEVDSGRQSFLSGGCALSIFHDVMVIDD